MIPDLMGMQIILNKALTKTVVRSWKERLFSLPWKPWERTKTVPDYNVLVAPGKLIMHPATFQLIEKSFDMQRRKQT